MIALSIFVATIIILFANSEINNAKKIAYEISQDYDSRLQNLNPKISDRYSKELGFDMPTKDEIILKFKEHGYDLDEDVDKVEEFYSDDRVLTLIKGNFFPVEDMTDDEFKGLITAAQQEIGDTDGLYHSYKHCYDLGTDTDSFENGVEKFSPSLLRNVLSGSKEDENEYLSMFRYSDADSPTEVDDFKILQVYSYRGDPSYERSSPGVAMYIELKRDFTGNEIIQQLNISVGNQKINTNNNIALNYLTSDDGSINISSTNYKKGAIIHLGYDVSTFTNKVMINSKAIELYSINADTPVWNVLPKSYSKILNQ